MPVSRTVNWSSWTFAPPLARTFRPSTWMTTSPTSVNFPLISQDGERYVRILGEDRQVGESLLLFWGNPLQADFQSQGRSLGALLRILGVEICQPSGLQGVFGPMDSLREIESLADPARHLPVDDLKKQGPFADERREGSQLGLASGKEAGAQASSHLLPVQRVRLDVQHEGAHEAEHVRVRDDLHARRVGRSMIRRLPTLREGKKGSPPRLAGSGFSAR